MKKSTIIRTVMLFLVLINLVLEKTGHNIIDVDESTVGVIVEYSISFAIIVLSWWKNNSFTNNAQKADEYLAELRRLEKEEATESLKLEDDEETTLSEEEEK
jgi:SPP1 family holin